MCIRPNNIPGAGLVACRKCWQCKENRVNDFVGRSIAEDMTSLKTVAATLTYGGGNVPNSAILTYSDVQEFLQGLRNKGFKVRYICVGEYGSHWGRAHWHIILFFSFSEKRHAKGQSSFPHGIYREGKYTWPYWKHGFTYLDDVNYETLKYALKYVLKNESLETSVNTLTMSKKPPLGDAFFRGLAEKYAAAELVPQHYFYNLPGILNPKGELRQFMIQGKSRDNFLKYWKHAWSELNATPCPESEIVNEFDDKNAALDPEWQITRLYMEIKEKAPAMWNTPLRHKVIRANSTFAPDSQVIKDEFGHWYFVKYNEKGRELWRGEVITDADKKAAALGKFPRPYKSDRNLFE